MYLVGLDIGFGNLKLVKGYANQEAQEEIYPVGAAPLAHNTSSLRGEAGDGIVVQVGGEEFIACVEPGKLANWQRALHQDYPSTSTYKALFHAALLATGQRTVDRLITGLPVSHFMVEEKREGLAKNLRGTHCPVSGRTVDVRQVEVIPQPVGCFLDLAYAAGREDEFSDAEVLVIDPGFFSVDWVLLSEGDVQYMFSGTSTQATSMLLDNAAKLIGQEFDSQLPAEKLERAIRGGRDQVRVYSNRVSIAPYIERAAKNTGQLVMDAVKTSLRTKAGNIDVVMLAGGGAGYYTEAVREVFPRAEILVAQEPVTANARGFWLYGLPS